MVTSMILSRYVGDLPEEGQERKILDGPLYKDVVDLIEKCDAQPWTKKCIRDVQTLSLDGEGIKAVVFKAVKTGTFLGSEWCQGTKEGVWAACDAYTFTDVSWCEAMHRDISNDYYVKFFVNTSGTVVFTVSLHLSN